MYFRSLLAVGSLATVAGCGGSAARSAPPGEPHPGGGAIEPADSGAPTLPTIPGATRVHFDMDSFSIPAGGEFYKCQDFPNPFNGDAAILESQSVMSAGSHHMFVFRLSTAGFFGGTPNLGPNNTKGPLVDCPGGGVEFHPFVHASQTLEQTFIYPKGIGQAFLSAETPRVMVHYLNTTAGTLHPTVQVTMDFVPKEQVAQLAASIFLNSLSVNVPPGVSTDGFTYTLPQAVQLLGASGHMHRRGTHFEATVLGTDGSSTQLYQTDDWNEPKPAAFEPAMPVASGTTIHWACTYSNATSQTFTFGESASTNEMCIFTGTYYPSGDGNGLYDNDADPPMPN